MDRTPLALIGAGGIARTHIDRIQRSENLRLVGIADPAPAAQALAASLGLPWFAEHTALLDALQPQGAIVATPNHWHVPQAVDCLERGVAALVEKPMADSVAEAQLLVDVHLKTGVPVLVGHHRRHNPINRRARDIIQSGRLGRLVSAQVMATFLKPDGYFDTAWRRESGGGPILINLIHDIDMLRFFMGEIVSVQAMASSAVRGFEVEDTAAATLRFASGALGTVLLSDTVTSPWCWDFCAGEQPIYPQQAVSSHFIGGTLGSISLPDLSLWHYQGERSWYAELTREQSAVHQLDPYAAQLQHFREVIQRAAAPLCSALDGQRSLQATLAVAEAAASGQTITITH